MSAEKIAIDAGGSLLKIAYSDNGKIHYRKHRYDETESMITWLKIAAPNAKAALTGGKAQQLIKDYYPEADLIPEFDALTEGALFLLKEERIELKQPFLLVNIGTGTSIILAGNGNKERITGSGLGGGTLIGLGEMLTGERDYYSLLELAGEGNRKNTDLLVNNIYSFGGEPLAGELTAANFAKGISENPKKSDLAAALLNMIAETLVLIASQAAAVHKVDNLVFVGSTLTGNRLLKEGLERYTHMLGLKSVFLEKGEYSGAAGALLRL